MGIGKIRIVGRAVSVTLFLAAKQDVPAHDLVKVDASLFHKVLDRGNKVRVDVLDFGGGNRVAFVYGRMCCKFLVGCGNCLRRPRRRHDTLLDFVDPLIGIGTLLNLVRPGVAALFPRAHFARLPFLVDKVLEVIFLVVDQIPSRLGPGVIVAVVCQSNCARAVGVGSRKSLGALNDIGVIGDGMTTTAGSREKAVVFLAVRFLLAINVHVVPEVRVGDAGSGRSLSHTKAHHCIKSIRLVLEKVEHDLQIVAVGVGRSLGDVSLHSVANLIVPNLDEVVAPRLLFGVEMNWAVEGGVRAKNKSIRVVPFDNLLNVAAPPRAAVLRRAVVDCPLEGERLDVLGLRAADAKRGRTIAETGHDQGGAVTGSEKQRFLIFGGS